MFIPYILLFIFSAVILWKFLWYASLSALILFSFFTASLQQISGIETSVLLVHLYVQIFLIIVFWYVIICNRTQYTIVPISGGCNGRRTLNCQNEVKLYSFWQRKCRTCESSLSTFYKLYLDQFQRCSIEKTRGLNKCWNLRRKPILVTLSFGSNINNHSPSSNLLY